MTEADRKARNAEMLSQLYPTFRAKIVAVLADLESHHERPRIQCAWRSPADQRKAYESGHSTLLYGWHNVTGHNGKPEALAVDLLDDDNPNSEPRSFVLLLAASARAHGLQTGICYGLKQAQRDAVSKAIAAKDWQSPVKIGWDPCHVEPFGHVAHEAKLGWRP